MRPSLSWQSVPFLAFSSASVLEEKTALEHRIFSVFFVFFSACIHRIPNGCSVPSFNFGNTTAASSSSSSLLLLLSALPLGRWVRRDATGATKNGRRRDKANGGADAQRRLRSSRRSRKRRGCA
eukprot:1994331-Rhodomonas_salina.1